VSGLALCGLSFLSLLSAVRAWSFEEPAVADRNLAAIILQLQNGNWNARMHAVHELEYMQDEGLNGLALATDDGDWQVRMTAVHAIGPGGAAGVPILNRLLKNETCPVVRLMTLHNLGSNGPDGEEAKAMGWINDSTIKQVNACRDQPGPGAAPWVKGRPWAKPQEARNFLPERTRPAPGADAPAVPAARDPDAVVTRDPVPPAPRVEPPAKKPARAPEDLPAPTKFERHMELDALLDLSTEAAAPRRGVVLEKEGKSAGVPETLPRAEGRTPGAHEVSAPGMIEKDAGTGKAPHDAIAGLLRALKQGDVRTRSRAADDLGHLGATAAPAVPALMAALRDRAARVRSSASLALGNIGSEREDVVPLLTGALKDKSEDVRYAAALALSRIDTPVARAAFNRHVGKEARRAIDRPKVKVR
jgi:hypothetical protein